MLDTGVNLSKTYKIFFFLIPFFFALSINKSSAQSLVEEISSPVLLGESAEIFTETIRIISRSQKIFILTNTNQMLNKGDFITLLLNQKGPVARALVGKTHDGSAGIKILKVYSLKRWQLMRKGQDVQILKGDDSHLFVEKKAKEPEEPKEEINSEEDLYDIDLKAEEDLNFFTKDNRYIKPDNLVGVGYSQLSFKNNLNVETQTEQHTQLNFSWGFQFSDNYWVEGLYGRTLISDFPATGAQTLINNFTLRLKYTFKLPLYSYLMPYVGFQIYDVSSPDAGIGDNAEKENQLIDDLGEDQAAFGITLLRRLVPGWFIKADLGNDILSIGAAIEF